MKNYVSDWFIGRLHEEIEAAFFDFQDKNKLDDAGDLPAELNDQLANAVDDLLNTMNKCMAWQLVNRE